MVALSSLLQAVTASPISNSSIIKAEKAELRLSILPLILAPLIRISNILSIKDIGVVGNDGDA